MAEHSGQCLCGAVKFKATPKSNEVGVCHCGICRRQNAGPFFALDCGDNVAFDNEDAIGRYSSSDWAERGFCKTCGTTLYWALKDKSLFIMSADTFDDIGELKLDHEVFIDEKPGYYSFAEKVKQMTGEEVFAAFGAP